MQIPSFSLFDHIVVDLGSAWTRAANSEGRRSAVKSERRGRAAIQAGAVADAAICAEILHDVFGTLRPTFSPFQKRLSVISSLPACATEEERATLTSTLYRSGAWNVVLIPQPLAAAMGAGLDVGSPYAQMVISVGDALTEYAVIRNGKVENSHSVKVGCATLRNAITSHCRLSTDHQSRELLRKMETHSLNEALDTLTTLEPAAATAPTEPSGSLEQNLRNSLNGSLSFLADNLLQLYRTLPDRAACEVIESGITLVGGGALLRELQHRLAATTGLSVRVPSNPLSAVLEGLMQVIPYTGYSALQ